MDFQYDLDPQAFPPLIDLFTALVPASGTKLVAVKTDPPENITAVNLPMALILIDPDTELTSGGAASNTMMRIDYTALVLLLVGERKKSTGLDVAHAQLRHWLIPVTWAFTIYPKLQVPKIVGGGTWQGVDHIGMPNGGPDGAGYRIKMRPASGNVRGLDCIGWKIKVPITEKWNKG